MGPVPRGALTAAPARAVRGQGLWDPRTGPPASGSAHVSQEERLLLVGGCSQQRQWPVRRWVGSGCSRFQLTVLEVRGVSQSGVRGIHPVPLLQSCSQALAVPGRVSTLHGVAPSSDRGARRAQVWARVGTRAPCPPADRLQSLGALWPLRPVAWPCLPAAALSAEFPRVPWACPLQPSSPGCHLPDP